MRQDVVFDCARDPAGLVTRAPRVAPDSIAGVAGDVLYTTTNGSDSPARSLRTRNVLVGPV
jgi:hypothetical protein